MTIVAKLVSKVSEYSSKIFYIEYQALFSNLEEYTSNNISISFFRLRQLHYRLSKKIPLCDYVDIEGAKSQACKRGIFYSPELPLGQTPFHAFCEAVLREKKIYLAK